MPQTPPLTRPVAAAGDRLSALLDAAVDAVILIDTRGRITRFNRAAERLFGYRAEEVLGRNVSMLMPEPYRSEHDDYMRRYLRTSQPRIIGMGREVVARRKDGSTFAVDLAVGEFRRAPQQPMRRSEDGEERGFVGILRDITERKEHEAQLRKSSEDLRRMLADLAHSSHEAEELRARLAHVGRIGTLGEMVSGIAHEVNQPLTAIATYASACKRLLASGRAAPEELVAPLEKIAEQADRAGQVIRGLRSLVRKREAVREPLDCNQLVRDVARLVDFDLKQTGFRLVLGLADDLPAAIGDGVQIQQVILNLIRNALDAMLEHSACDAVEVVTAAVDRAWVEVRVSDCGPGISPDVSARLFEPFFTTKPQGIGLGLSICHSIVAAHDGELEHRPRSGGGTVFTIRLPTREG